VVAVVELVAMTNLAEQVVQVLLLLKKLELILTHQAVGI